MSLSIVTMTEEQETMETFDDGDFVVYRTAWDTYASRDKDGNNLCSSLDKDGCIYWSREHLNGFKTSTAHVTNVSMAGDSLK